MAHGTAPAAVFPAVNCGGEKLSPAFAVWEGDRAPRGLFRALSRIPKALLHRTAGQWGWLPRSQAEVCPW